MFPAAPFRKASVPSAAGTHRRISDWRLSCAGMSYDDMSPKNLVAGGMGYSPYPAWSAASTYTFTTAATAVIVEHAGTQWVLHTTQAPTATFPAHENWFELRPLLWYRNIWGDVMGVPNAAQTKAVIDAAQATDPSIKIYQYIYLPGAKVDGSDHFNLGTAPRDWLDANSGYLYCDGDVASSTNKSCTTTSGSNVVACANTSGLTLGMGVSGIGVPSGARINTITVNTSFTLVQSVPLNSNDTPVTLNATVSGTNTLTFDNRIALGEVMGTSNMRFVSPAKLARIRDANGDDYYTWHAKQMRSDSTFSAWRFAGLACDDMICTRPYYTAEGDDYNTSGTGQNPYSAGINYWGYGHHRAGALEGNLDAAARTAVAQGMALGADSLRKGYPGARIWYNAGQSKPFDEWAGKIDHILLEGVGSYYSLMAQAAQPGWRQTVRDLNRMSAQARSRRLPCNVSWRQYDDRQSPGTAGRPRSIPFHQDALFALATVLMTDACYSYQRTGYWDGSVVVGAYADHARRRFYIAEMDAELGVPVGAPFNPDAAAFSVATREYTNGLVLCCPKHNGDHNTWATQPASDFVLPFACRRLTGTLNPADDGSVLPAGSVVSLSPWSGLVLLRA